MRAAIIENAQGGPSASEKGVEMETLSQGPAGAIFAAFIKVLHGRFVEVVGILESGIREYAVKQRVLECVLVNQRNASGHWLSQCLFFSRASPK